MTQQTGILRIIAATSGIWRANKLAEFISSLDDIVCRATAACLLSDLLRRHNEELASLQAMGLLRPGMSPADWGEAVRGTDALSRDGYLQVATDLKRHGIIVRQEHLGWKVDFEFDDIVEIVPQSMHLEVEFIQLASPGLGSFIQAGSKVAKDEASFLRHIFDRWTEPEAKKRLLQAEIEMRELQVNLAREETNQASQKTRIMKAIADRVEKELSTLRVDNITTTLDYAHRRDGIRGALMDGGLPLQKIEEVILKPLEDRINRLARFVCDRLVSAIAIDFLPQDDQKDKIQSTEK
ncbi:MAG: hypothetical protein JXB42_05110 [Deltaproteobacteria bacterium]|nr:hypothetical protein [Deltaproteobacteria bacterium]